MCTVVCVRANKVSGEVKMLLQVFLTLALDGGKWPDLRPGPRIHLVSTLIGL